MSVRADAISTALEHRRLMLGDSLPVIRCPLLEALEVDSLGHSDPPNLVSNLLEGQSLRSCAAADTGNRSRRGVVVRHVNVRQRRAEVLLDVYIGSISFREKHTLARGKGEAGWTVLQVIMADYNYR